MTRLALSILAAVSLILLIGDGVSWRMTQDAPLQISWPKGQFNAYHFSASSRGVTIGRSQWVRTSPSINRMWSHLGIEYQLLRACGFRIQSIEFSHAWISLALVAPPVAWIFQRRSASRHQSAKGACLGCGYDLRASPTRCPECGLSRQHHGLPGCTRSKGAFAYRRKNHENHGSLSTSKNHEASESGNIATG